MLKSRYWIKSLLLLLALNLIAIVNNHINQFLLTILESIGELLLYVVSLLVNLLIGGIGLSYFHLWLRERRIMLSLDLQSIRSAILSFLILFLYYNTIALIDLYSKYFMNVEIIKTNPWSVASIYFIIFCAFFYFLFDNFKIVRK
jgi:hypothetical protein